MWWFPISSSGSNSTSPARLSGYFLLKSVTVEKEIPVLYYSNQEDRWPTWEVLPKMKTEFHQLKDLVSILNDCTKISLPLSWASHADKPPPRTTRTSKIHDQEKGRAAALPIPLYWEQIEAKWSHLLSLTQEVYSGPESKFRLCTS